jgi:hypothetical protein
MSAVGCRQAISMGVAELLGGLGQYVAAFRANDMGGPQSRAAMAEVTACW